MKCSFGCEMEDEDYSDPGGEPEMHGWRFTNRRESRARRRYSKWRRSLRGIFKLPWPSWSRLADYQREWAIGAFGG